MPLEVLSREGDPATPAFAVVKGEVILGQPALGFLWVRQPMVANASTEIVFFGRAIVGDFIEVVVSTPGPLDHVAALDVVKRQELDGLAGKVLPTTPFSNPIAQRGYEVFLPTLEGLLIFARDAKAMERRYYFKQSFPMATPFIDDGVLNAVDQGVSVAEALTNAVAKQIIGDRSLFAFTDEHVERLRDAAWCRLPHVATAMFLLGHLKAEQMPRTEREGRCAIVLGRLMKSIQDQFADFLGPYTSDAVDFSPSSLGRGLDFDWEAAAALIERCSGNSLETSYDVVSGVDFANILSTFYGMVLSWLPADAMPPRRFAFSTRVLFQDWNLLDLLRVLERFQNGPGSLSLASIWDERGLSYEAWRPLLPAMYRDMSVEQFEAQMYRERSEMRIANEVLA
jgi:hypothetical protein